MSWPFPPGGLKLSYGDAPYDIHLEARGVGDDILAAVTGGTRPHVGAVALAEPPNAPHPVTGERQKSGSAKGDGSGIERNDPCVLPQCRVSTLSAEGHKDAVIAEMAAHRLCEKYGVSVCVSAGVHVDGASVEEIALMVDNAKTLLGIV